MNILEQKISQTDMEAAGVVSLPDVLNGSAKEISASISFQSFKSGSGHPI